ILKCRQCQAPNVNTQQKASVAKGVKAIGKKKDEKEGLDTAEGEEWMQGKTLVKPPDQLDLTEAELNEEITRVLTANNPNAPQNVVRYSFKVTAASLQLIEMMLFFFEQEGNLVHKESDEGRRLMANQAEVDDSGGDERPDNVAIKAGKREQKLTNQFNFNERASQTLKNPPRDISCQTEPPPRANFSAIASQWEIYDFYVEELQRREKSKEKHEGQFLNEEDKSKKKMIQAETQNDDISQLAKTIKIIERMVNQNIFDDVAQDFMYFEDASDEFRGEKGTLLPLWTFQYEKAKSLSVTALCWNHKYNDLFTVGLGSHEFIQQGGGMLIFYTLKNPSYPEFIFNIASGVMCVDIHEHLSYLVAVGLYDKLCCSIYNLKKKTDLPIYKSRASSGKHTSVNWQKDDLDGNHNFISVSADGQVVSWTLVKKTFSRSTGLVGTSLDFHKQKDYSFLVGTEHGKIHKGSRYYSSKFLETYDNPFHPDVFISCGWDWMVKIWDQTLKSPVFTFELKTSVTDVVKSPTDSNTNTMALCQQKVVSKKTRLLHIEFNPVHPIIIVGHVTSLKLSPNLRTKPKVGDKPTH
uniref:Dynein, axonemal, intermediate chain 1, paralog 2 n=1 Tax=Sinocyclocheilus rhinocerous TaxID=307959 RepID=A0A673JDB4_9TELE